MHSIGSSLGSVGNRYSWMTKTLFGEWIEVVPEPRNKLVTALE